MRLGEETIGDLQLWLLSMAQVPDWGTASRKPLDGAFHEGKLAVSSICPSFPRGHALQISRALQKGCCHPRECPHLYTCTAHVKYLLKHQGYHVCLLNYGLSPSPSPPPQPSPSDNDKMRLSTFLWGRQHENRLGAERVTVRGSTFLFKAKSEKACVENEV